MNIGPYSFEEFMDVAARFHGYPAPGLIIGGYMVELARSRLPENTLFDAIVETPKCLPDAVQLLTLCSLGNGWLKVVNLGRYALALYDKFTGVGVRVHLDPAKLAMWPEISAWYLKLKAKKEQNRERLFEEIRKAGPSACGVSAVRVPDRFLKKASMGAIGICPVCREAYPVSDGGVCRGCSGESPFGTAAVSEEGEGPRLVAVPLEQAVGKRALHDMTRIVPSVSKGAEFHAGQTIGAGDICRLQQMGRAHIYVEEESRPDGDWVHEDQAARAFARAMAGTNVLFSDHPREGKVNFLPALTGLLVVNRPALERFNLVPGVMCATRQSHLVVEKDRAFAACRAIPLYLARRQFESALAALDPDPLFQVLPLRQARVGVLVTGTEVFQGLIEDKFIPVIKSKVDALGSSIRTTAVVPDDRAAIARAATDMIREGADLIVTTAGLSVDPDDVTRLGLVDAGLEDTLYGAPILPGAMTLVGRIGQVQVLGVPACALFYAATSLDLLLPRLLAGEMPSRKDLAGMAEGGFCLGCKACTFPKCPFGK